MVWNLFFDTFGRIRIANSPRWKISSDSFLPLILWILTYIIFFQTHNSRIGFQSKFDIRLIITGFLLMHVSISYFSVAKATLELQMSVCLSVHNQNPSASQNWAYLPVASLNCAYWSLCLSAIWSSFATSKPFGLFGYVSRV